MPVNPTYPGVYIEEIPSGVRTIMGVATSITAFIGRALKGPVQEPVRIQSFGDYERVFGQLWAESTMSYALQHYFLNGGTDALVVRLINGGGKSRFSLTPESGANNLILEASSEGRWGDNLRVVVDHNTRDLAPAEVDKVFNLFVSEIDPVTKLPRYTESFRNIAIEATAPRYVGKVLAQDSLLLRVPEPHPAPAPTVRPAAIDPNTPASPTTAGDDGLVLDFPQYEGSKLNKTGIYALEKADLFNLLCIPPFSFERDVADSTWSAALKYCQDRRAMLLVDPRQEWDTVSEVETAINNPAVFPLARDKNAALYFPRLKMPDPLKENRPEVFAPGGAVAGLWARTDANRGVWKAPAGMEATLRGVIEMAVKLTDGENGRLNPLGVNCLRSFPVVGHVVWGARTLEGADRLASEWKYLPVRRFALFIEESLYRGTQWVVFEPNDEPLWAQIRLNVGAFLHGLFRQGAFAGKTPREAYFVKCDGETTTPNDVNQGIVNIVVGFAPLKPAEFVIIKIQQIAPQLQT